MDYNSCLPIIYIVINIFSYKNAIDGLLRVIKEEGFFRSFNGASMASSRAVLVTIGQVCV